MTNTSSRYSGARAYIVKASLPAEVRYEPTGKMRPNMMATDV
jgi:hypothetical protein